ncbi:hypothetical protein PoB_007492900 [Plakobranchus ocellatus]|uniref:Uncharacterized protein n=1 Tax=Plakobranchus ocellatus TaxID=259542 RepID=A0AAV4DWE7_9GAST|nr:hypothetical protein PoB_007492900 [Plakobranchus ocellatus]
MGMPVRELRDMVTRSLISVPTKFPVPHRPVSASGLCLNLYSSLSGKGQGAHWVDHSYSCQLVDAWLDVLPKPDRLDVGEMCLGLQPSNVQLLLR